MTRAIETTIGTLPRRQARVLGRIRQAGCAYLDRSEHGATWRTPDGRRIGSGVIRRLCLLGLLSATGDALLPDDTQTLVLTETGRQALAKKGRTP